MVIEKFPYIFKKFVKSPVAKINKIVFLAKAMIEVIRQAQWDRRSQNKTILPG